jgi:hypothetical protein
MALVLVFFLVNLIQLQWGTVFELARQPNTDVHQRLERP